jgi:hypothetical protein
MELKQIAESITRVTHAKKIQSDKSTFAYNKFGPPIVRTTRGMVNDNTKVVFNETKKVTKDSIGYMNRPLVLVESLKIDDKPQTENKIDHLFRLEFDGSVGINPTWVDTKTLNFFNKLRDNIFASSGQYDTLPAVSQEIQEKPQAKKNRFSSIESQIKKDKNSVAF